METCIIPITDDLNMGKFIIFRPRVGLAFVGNHVMASLAQSLANDLSPETVDKDVMEFLNAIGFFQPDPPPPVLNEDFRPTTAVLLLTNQCQLRCTYCYAAAGELPREQLSIELGQAAIDHVYQNALDLGLSQFEISFHGGGEPTYAWSVLKECAAYARQKPIRAVLSLTSNGIWSPQQREWILNNLNSVSLSLDGGQETQDSQRPLVSGKGSSEFVMQTVADLDHHHFPYGIRMTATAPWTNLPLDVRFLCEETQCPSMQVEPAFNTKRGGHNRPDRSEGLAFAEAYLEASEIASQAGRRLQYSGARLGVVTTTFCTAPHNALIVGGSGDLVTCYEITNAAHPLAGISTVGRIENGQVMVNTAARERLHTLMDERRAACRDCPSYWSCAGDCYARTFVPGEGGHQKRSTRCAMNRWLTERMLLKRIADGGGVWRAMNDYRALPTSGTTVEAIAN